MTISQVRSGAVALFILILGVAGPLSIAQAAAVSNLRSAAIQPAGLPSLFKHSHLKLYQRFSASMKVRTAEGSAHADSVCRQPAKLASFGWNGGMIQAFDRAAASDALQLCASRYKSAGGAHQAYGVLVAAIIKPQITLHLQYSLKTRIGDESTGMTSSQKHCLCDTKATIFTHEVVFRHANVVIDLDYAGPATFTSGQFLRLVTRTNAQLH